MPFKDTQTRKERLSSTVSGDVRDRNRAGPSMIRLNSAATMPRYGMPVSGLRGKTPKDQSRVPVGTIDIRGHLGDERTGVRKPVSAFRQPPAVKKTAAKAKPAQVVSTTVRERTTPSSAKAPTPARMAVNPRTGSTLGFTSGSRTGSTVTKAGVAGKTSMTGMQRMSQNAFNKGGVAGPSRPSGGGGRNASSASRPSSGRAGGPAGSRSMRSR